MVIKNLQEYFMNIINGEMFQNLCSVQISKKEHKKFESNTNSIDIASAFVFFIFSNLVV